MKLVHFTRLAFAFSATLTLNGCLDSGNSSGPDDALTGQIHFNGLSGIRYQTSSQSGTTNQDGQFHYYPGETLTLQVGNLVVAEGVPARPYISVLEFMEEPRARLQKPGVDDRQLSNHTVTESALRQRDDITNLTRFLMALTWSDALEENQGLEIRDRVVSQLDAALADPQLPDTLDFSLPTAEFTAQDSAANRLLAQICFFPEGDELCQKPPTLADIGSAPPRPTASQPDPDIDYREDLLALRERILGGARTLDMFNNERAGMYLKQELDAITRALSRQYHLSPEQAKHPATDTSIQSVQIKKVSGEPSLARMEAQSTRSNDVYIHAHDWQSASADYVVAGEAGGESELLINFRPDDNYRWVRKEIRVLID